MTARTDIVDALKTVPELSPTATMPDNIMAGMAWPVRDHRDPLTGCLRVTTWYVFVALPAANTASTVEWADDLIDTIWEALQSAGKVLRDEEWRIPLEPGQQGIPVQRFTLEV